MKRLTKTFLTITMVVAGLFAAFTAGADPHTATMYALQEFNAETLTGFAAAGIVVNQSNLAAIFTGFKNNFQDGFKGAEQQWKTFASEFPSMSAKELYGWLGQLPQLREWVGDRVVKNLSVHDYEILNKDFESTIGVPRNSMNDDTYGVFSKLFESMGDVAAKHPDSLVFETLLAGFANECYDGQYFFDTDHPVGENSVSNFQAGAGDAWFLLDCSRPIKPIIFQNRKPYTFTAMNKEDDENVFMKKQYVYGVDARVAAGYSLWQLAFGSKATLDSASFETNYAAMMGLKDEHDKPLGVRPTHLMVGSSNRAAAKTIIDAEKNAAGASNINYKAVEVVVSPYLA